MSLVCDKCGSAVHMRGSVLAPQGFECTSCGALDSQVHEHEYIRSKVGDNSVTLYNKDGEEEETELLPDGVWDRDGKYFADCCSCHEETEIECDLDEFDLDNHYCGRSPRCCP